MPPVIGRFSSAKTHSDCLNIICSICWRKKGSMRAVSDTVSDLIMKYVYEGYKRDGGVHPKVICDGCRKTWSDIHNNPDDSQRHLPPTPPYHLLGDVVGCVTHRRVGRIKEDISPSTHQRKIHQGINYLREGTDTVDSVLASRRNLMTEPDRKKYYR